MHNELFVGLCRNFVEATDPEVNYKTFEQEQFVDLSLDIEGCEDLYASIISFCKEEKLEGPNQINTDGSQLVVGSDRCYNS